MFNLPYNKFQKTLEIVTFILLLAQIVYTAVLYPQLPIKIPSHFNLEGQIDGWSGKESIIILVIIIYTPDCYNVLSKIVECAGQNYR